MSHPSADIPKLLHPNQPARQPGTSYQLKPSSSRSIALPLDMDTLDQSSSLASLPRSSDFDVDPSSFSAAAWLNHVLTSSSSSPPDLSSLQDVLSDALRESHESLDVCLRDALRAVPWVVRESDHVRQRTKALRVEVDNVGTRVAGVETGVASSVKTIADADTVVRRVQNAAILLETAASADVLLERLESLLASAGGADGTDLVTAADVAAQLRNALKPLHDVEQLKDRFGQLDRADSRLETLAAPQLRRALDARDAQAAVNSRIVFDHAGRQNAFRAQYVALRGKQVCKVWSDAWVSHQQSQRLLNATGETETDTENIDVENNSTSTTTNISNKGNNTTSHNSGEFAAEGADIALRTFYDAVTTLVSTEAEWLREVFPDVKAILLPALLCDSLSSLKEPSPRANIFIHPSVSDAVVAADAIGDRLFAVAEISVSAAATIAEILTTGEDEFNIDDKSTTTTTTTTTINKHYSRDEDSYIQQQQNGNGDKSVVAQPSQSTSTTTAHKDQTTADAVSALLMPWRMFWDTLIQLSVRQARLRAEAIPMSTTTTTTINTKSNTRISSPQPLSDIARDVELCTQAACAALDHIVGTVTARTCGIGISAMKQACNTTCTVVTDRIRKALPLSSSSSYTSNAEDEWTRLGGALRLLVATSALKRSWDTRKEAAFAVAVGSASPILEVAGAVAELKGNESGAEEENNGNLSSKENGRGSGARNRVVQLIASSKTGARAEAGIVWELGRDTQLAKRVIREFETLDNNNNRSSSGGVGGGRAVGANGDGNSTATSTSSTWSSTDFDRVVSGVHQVVYDTMFAGVISRFDAFAKQGLWTIASKGASSTPSSSTTGSNSTMASNTTDAMLESSDADMAMAGLSTSPLRYATEVADYLMAIPQQLEPFVPDDDDARFATPRSVLQFCKQDGAAVAVGENKNGAEEGEEEMSFAGMWISVLAMGTMELYVEKMCSVARLSEAAAKQLATDADYLCNVMGSLGVAPSSNMALVCKLLEAKADGNALAEIAAEYDGAEHRKLVRRVAAVRGINVTL